MRGPWEPWTEPHLVVDSATDSPETAVRRALAYASSTASSAL